MSASAARAFGVVLAALGLALLLVSFLLDWFEFSGESADLWQSFDVVDVFVAASMFAAVAAGPAAVFAERQGLAVTVATVSANLAVLATALLCWRVIDLPGEDVSRAVGIWVGLGLEVGILVTSFAAMGGGAPPRLSSAR